MAAFNRRRLLLLKSNLLLLLYLANRRKKLKFKKKRECWIRDIYRDREEKGEYHSLVKELKIHDRDYFFRCFRMTPTLFEELLEMVAPYITKQYTQLRDPISPSERLCVTLRYLATGDAQKTIGASYRMSSAIIGKIIPETCNAIWNVLLANDYIGAPKSEKDWREIAKGFFSRWNFPNVAGAIDGKHVLIQAPARSGSMYFNYKKTFSIVLMAVCDSKYRFTLVDIGDFGSQSDGSVFANSFLGYAIESGILNIPQEMMLPNSLRKLPVVFVGDDAFGLKPNMMKPYPFHNLTIPQKVFNYRLSRARRVIENAFGIAAARFRILHRPIIAKVSTVKSVTKAITALHNFLIYKSQVSDHENQYCPPNYVDTDRVDGILPGQWRVEENQIMGLRDINRLGSNNYSKNAKLVRDEFREYFIEEGAVDWQWDIVNKCN